MKVLVIREFHFALPDDFEGTHADALRLLADYRGSKRPVYRDSPRWKYMTSWQKFLEVIRLGRRWRGKIGIEEHDGTGLEAGS